MTSFQGSIPLQEPSLGLGEAQELRLICNLQKAPTKGSPG